jgi:hypothetical protein
MTIDDDLPLPAHPEQAIARIREAIAGYRSDAAEVDSDISMLLPLVVMMTGVPQSEFDKHRQVHPRVLFESLRKQKATLLLYADLEAHRLLTYQDFLASGGKSNPVAVAQYKEAIALHQGLMSEFPETPQWPRDREID